MEQNRHLTFIEQAMAELATDKQRARPREVQAWLLEKHGIDLPIEQVHGNMQTVHELAEKAIHWLVVGFVSPRAKEWIEQVGGQVKEVSSDPHLIAVGLAYDPNGAWVWSHGPDTTR